MDGPPVGVIDGVGVSGGRSAPSTSMASTSIRLSVDAPLRSPRASITRVWGCALSSPPCQMIRS
jgi:hypothetical protein